MFCDNLIQLRKYNKMTQEELAEKVGVSRQAIAKWETGETVPDLERSKLIAEVFNVSLDELVNYTPELSELTNPPPKGKHLFGLVKVGDKGQIVIPAKARQVFDIKQGDELLVLGDETQGLAIIKANDFLDMAAEIMKMHGKQ